MKILYGWPVERSHLEYFAPSESPVHKQVAQLKHACDFIVPLNTPVLAMREGEIAHQKMDSSRGGDDLGEVERVKDSKYWNSGNRIEIHHGNQEYSAYEHLAPGTNRFRVGDRVGKGDVIAVTGYTGLMAHLGPHLHAERFKWFGPGEDDYETLKIDWEAEALLLTYLGIIQNGGKWELKK